MYNNFNIRIDRRDTIGNLIIVEGYFHPFTGDANKEIDVDDFGLSQIIFAKFTELDTNNPPSQNVMIFLNSDYKLRGYSSSGPPSDSLLNNHFNTDQYRFMIIGK